MPQKRTKFSIPKPISIRDRVYESIRSDVLSGRMISGERIVEARLAQEIRTSRTPVREALHMLEQTRAFKILKGIRGRNPRDMDSIVDALLRLGQLAVDFPEIEELDINPLFVLDDGKGSIIGDARMILTTTV